MLRFVYIGVGLLAWVAALVHWQRVRRWLSEAVDLQGQILRLEGARPGEEPRKGATAYPVVRFDLNGSLHEARARMGMPFRALDGKEAIPIKVRPGHPEDVRLGRHADRNLSFTLAGLGLMVIAIGIAQIL